MSVDNGVIKKVRESLKKHVSVSEQYERLVTSNVSLQMTLDIGSYKFIQHGGLILPR